MDADDEKLEETIEDILRAAGMTGTTRGMWYTKYAIQLDVQDPEILLKGIYVDVATHYKTTPKGVERAMRGSIITMWDSDQGPAALSEMAGHPVKRRPTNSELVDLVSYYIRRYK